LADASLAAALRQLTQVVLASDACSDHLRQPA
jgi:hypothetical protein